MKNQMRKISLILLSIMLIIGISIESYGAIGVGELEKAIEETASYMYKTVSEPQPGSIGGEWAIIGLGRSGYKLPDKYYEGYYEILEGQLRAEDGILHDKKYTEYSRAILALTAMGKDPRDVAGYNLLTPLADYEKTTFQGINGPIWALIALDSGAYDMPRNEKAKLQATRDMYIDNILDSQLADGGWSLMGGTQYDRGNEKTDPDISAMALQALSKYRDRPRVEEAIDKALKTLSSLQDEDAGLSSWGSKNLESSVQLIVALGELGISLEDERFMKSGNTLLDNLFKYYIEGQGFKHSEEETGSNQMASEQGFYGLVAARRLIKGENSLYRMKDIKEKDIRDEKSTGLVNKHKDIKQMPIVKKDISFDDISSYKYKDAIEELASRGIIKGKSQREFDPKGHMTRAEFATIIVQGLGLELEKKDIFTDVGPSDWFYEYVASANKYEIIAGISKDKFNPNGSITTEEAVTILARTGSLAGMEVVREENIVRDTLSQFEDYMSVEDWARPSMAFAYDQGILDDSPMEIKPKEIITRGEIADMIFNMLDRAKLL